MKGSMDQLVKVAQDVLDGAIGADAHVDTAQRLLIEGVNLNEALSDGHVDYPRLRRGSVSVLFAALWTPVYYPPDDALNRTWDLLSSVQGFCAHSKGHFSIGWHPNHVEAKKISLILSLEGCHPLGTDIGLLSRLKESGISSITLTHVA